MRRASRFAKRQGLTLDDALQAFLKAINVKGNTFHWLFQQEKILLAFIAFSESNSGLYYLEDAEPHHMDAYLDFCKNVRGNGQTTLRNKAIVIRSFALYALKSGLVPRCRLAFSEVPADKAAPVDVADYDAYLTAIKAYEGSYRDEFLVLLGSGMRRGELMNLRFVDINLDAGELYVRRRRDWSPKNRKDRIVALTGEAREALARIVERRRKPGHMGPYLDEQGKPTLYPTTLSHAWVKFVRSIGLPTRIHALRHAHATKAVNSGAILPDVQAQLGHSDIRVTMRYVRPNSAGPRRVIAAISGEDRKG
jgi:integrase